MSEWVKKPVFQGVVLFIASCAVLGSILFHAPGFITSDDYYHVRISGEIIKQGSLSLDFPWLPQTILSSEKYTDHHLLFHIILAPFVFFFDVLGAKVTIILIGSGVFLMFWLILRKLKVFCPFLWTIALFGMSSFFLYRLLMIRPTGMSLLFLLISLLIMFSKRYRLLLPLGFFYAWLYDGFPMLLVFSILYALAVWLSTRKREFGPIVFTLLGILLGIVINPYFPQNMSFIADHLRAKIFFDQNILVGGEWYPLTTRQVLYYFPGALLAILGGLIRPWNEKKKRDEVEFFLLLIALFTGGLALYAVRFFEYFPLFALLFAAVSIGRNPGKIIDNMQQLRFFLLVFIIIFGGMSLTFAFDSLKSIRSSDEFKGAAMWLEQNTDSGTLVFTAGFNDFSRLFFYNQQNTYVIGLDPTYLDYADKNTYEKYRQITTGEIKNPSTLISETFHSRYVVSSKQLHSSFNRQALRDTNMQLVFEDEYNYVWTIR